MASDLNMWQGIGRLGKDVELRITAGGDAVANFSIACGWKTKDKEGAEWVNITAFGKLGEICGKYLKKGSQVYIAGSMRTDKYTDKTSGVEKFSTKVVAEKMQMLGGKPDGGEQPPHNAKLMQTAPAVEGYTDDDIPF
ncbi:Ssb Single-stranded DNA-binding protein [uncultured Caudovirales phage]|uniref:Ssb Single-stranded DNA-binding protein n=1 Tax=uncultured Caudovirales phage TaxID=2100421 RepID=A0A6J5KHG7_9CAUD|nr:Ssb Single-stranded DNA-binding protein [uncultured Caudovirales phage]